MTYIARESRRGAAHLDQKSHDLTSDMPSLLNLMREIRTAIDATSAQKVSG